MQSFIIVLLLIICVALIVWLVSLYFKYQELKKTFRNHKKILRSVTRTINSVRYGNLYERVPDETSSVLPNLSQSVNSMIEAIVDREGMIKEYQSELNKKINVFTTKSNIQKSAKLICSMWNMFCHHSTL